MTRGLAAAHFGPRTLWGATDEIRLSATTVNQPDALALAIFYAELTGGVTKGSEHWATVSGPNGFIAFQQVDDFYPPVWPGADVPMQMRHPARLPAELRPLLGVRRPGRPSLLPVHLGRAAPG